METQYVIKQSQIQEILKALGECPHKYVHMSSAILVSLPELAQEEDIRDPRIDNGPQLIEG